MCGRTTMPGRHDIFRKYQLDKYGKLAPYNLREQIYVAGDLVPAIVCSNEQRILTGMHWGFGDVYNARIETVKVKPFWKESYLRYRMVFPISSFFERKWFTSKEPMAAAGIYQPITDFQGKLRYNASLLTQASTGIVSDHHPRMPVLIPLSEMNDWLISVKDIDDFTYDPELEYAN